MLVGDVVHLKIFGQNPGPNFVPENHCQELWSPWNECPLAYLALTSSPVETKLSDLAPKSDLTVNYSYMKWRVWQSSFRWSCWHGPIRKRAAGRSRLFDMTEDWNLILRVKKSDLSFFYQYSRLGPLKRDPVGCPWCASRDDFSPLYVQVHQSLVWPPWWQNHNFRDVDENQPQNPTIGSRPTSRYKLFFWI